MKAFASELGFQAAFRTSALTGEGVKELLQQIENAIDWEKLPITVSERLFKQMKEFIVNQKQNGHVLKTVTDIMQQFRIMYPESSFNDNDCHTAIENVEFHDLVKRLSFCDYVLLQPEMLDNYASAMAVAAREQPDGLGFLEEQAAREGNFKFGSLERVQEDEEYVILQSVVELFITKELALIDEGKLVFPSQFNRELPEYPNVQGSTVAYEFEGALLNAYATLVVRLYHSEAFKLESLWKNAAIFLPYGLKGEKNKCGFILKELDEGTGLITTFFMTLVGKAGQIFRPIPNDDWGIDGEIEFKNNKGQASGDRIYVQLKSGGSYLRTNKDGVSTFYISDERHIEYWLSHEYDVYLIVRDTDEKSYWMNITKYLKKCGAPKPRTIIFNRDELTIEAIKDLRRARLADAARALKPTSMG